MAGHADKIEEFRRIAQRQAIDSLQSAVALDDRHYDRAIANQGAVLKSSAQLTLLLADLRGQRLDPVSTERLQALANSDPGA